MGDAHSTFVFNDTHDLIKRPKLIQLFEFSPEFATVNGYRGFDHRLSHADLNGVQAEMGFIQAWLHELQQLPRDRLSPDQRLDLQLFEQYHALHQYYFDEIGTWRRNPDAITHIGQICFLMLLYETDNEEQRFSDIAARLEALPRYVQELKSRLEPAPQRWRDLTIQTTQSMPVFFDAVIKAAVGKISAALTQRLDRAAAEAKQETAAYITWLKTECPVDARESWVLGPEHFAEMMRLRNLGLDVAQILELGHTYLAQYETEYRRLAKQLVGSDDITAARALIERHAPPDFQTALETTHCACEEAKQFIQAKGLMSVPPGEELRIMETPEFLRLLIPFAAIFPPAKFAATQVGNYIVTPPAQAAQLSRNLNYANLYNTAVHEAYPGHHLQLSTSNLSASLLRSAPFVGGKPTEFVEGWAHYCEELMKDHGFHDTVEGRFVMVGDLIWRATRIIVDVKLSQGEMSYDEAVQMLMTKARLPEDGARAEVNRYTYSPGYQLSYLIGKHLIRDLKSTVQKKEGPAFSERTFHDRILRAGCLPITVLRERVFGIVD